MCFHDFGRVFCFALLVFFSPIDIYTELKLWLLDCFTTDTVGKVEKGRVLLMMLAMIRSYPRRCIIIDTRTPLITLTCHRERIIKCLVICIAPQLCDFSWYINTKEALLYIIYHIYCIYPSPWFWKWAVWVGCGCRSGSPPGSRSVRDHTDRAAAESQQSSWSRLLLHNTGHSRYTC